MSKTDKVVEMSGAKSEPEAMPHEAGCPHCKTRPALVSCKPMVLGPFIAQVLYCGSPECGTIFNIQIVGQAEQPRIAVPQGKISLQ